MLCQIRPKSHKNYSSLPIFGPLLDEFTGWSHKRGYSIHTIKSQLHHTRHIINFFQKTDVQSFNDLSHDHFEHAWQNFRDNHSEIAGTVRQLELFMNETRGLPLDIPSPKSCIDIELESFTDYLKDVRGLETTTIQSHVHYLIRFLNFISFESNDHALTNLQSKQIEDFICSCSKSLNRYSLQHVVGYLRAFLRFEYSRGVLQIPFHEMIDTPRIYRLEKLPRSLPWEVVNKLLLSINRSEEQGIRNYAMLLLITTYGLRSCEIASLTLDDIIWRDECFRVVQRKTGGEIFLPLTNAVAEALIDYLKNGRPDLPWREVFLRVRAPHGRLKPTAVATAFQREVRLSGLDIPYQGPHCLRHSYAVHLLRKGTSIKVIGDILGHRNAESTCVYLRLSIDDLRDVALDVPDYSGINSAMNINALESLPKARTCKRIRPSGPLKSFLVKEITAYLKLQHALGKKYICEQNVLYLLDSFLTHQCPGAKDLSGEIFTQWCRTFQHLSSTAKRMRMRIVRNFCLYRRRSYPHTFIPDILIFPAKQPPLTPYILSTKEIAQILSATKHLPPSSQNPIRADTIRIAIILLYTCGLRRGELQRLTIGNFDPVASTLLIKDTKFHKSRIIPLSPSADAELRAYLNLRRKSGLPIEISSPTIWNKSGEFGRKYYSGVGLGHNWRLLCASLKILTPKGIPPRIHDIRHSFAVNSLLRWYNDDEDVQTKLPQLSTYMGHVSVVSTQHYLTFIESIRTAASTRFEKKFGSIVTHEIENSNS